MNAVTRSLVARENLMNTPSAVAYFTVGLIFTLTSIISVALRLRAKQINKSKIITEDWLCITSLVFVIGLFICINLHIQLGGVGHHTADLPLMDLSYTLQILVAYQSFYCLSVGFVKSSICFFYIRIFAVNRTYRMVAYAVVAFIAAWTIMSVLVAFLSCTPFEFTWNPMVPGGSCDNQVGSFVAEAVLDLVADLMVFALPLRPIWKLQVNNGKKLVLFFIFGLGVSTMIMAILRIIGLSQLDYPDFQYSAVPPLIYSILEPSIGISVACIPLLQPLIKDTWLGRQLARSGKTTKRSYPYKQGGGYKQMGGGEENPLKSFEPHSVSVSARGTGTSGSVNEPEDYEAYQKQNKSGGITVKREFVSDSVSR